MQQLARSILTVAATASALETVRPYSEVGSSIEPDWSIKITNSAGDFLLIRAEYITVRVKF